MKSETYSCISAQKANIKHLKCEQLDLPDMPEGLTESQKSFLTHMVKTNNSTSNGGATINGENNTVNGYSLAIGYENTINAEESLAIGSNNSITHDNCTIVGDSCESVTPGQTILGGKLTFQLPHEYEIWEKDLKENQMVMCVSKEGDLLYKLKFDGVIRTCRVPTYGPQVRVVNEVKDEELKINIRV